MDTLNTLESAIQPKTHFNGKVIKTTIAGAVIDIGQKMPGIVHISQLSKEPVNRVEDILQVGQTVDVWIRRVRDGRIELTMIEPLALEWRELKSDMVVKGKVSRLEAYGAFVDIGTERPGLVHVSEISHSYVKTPSEVLKEGEEVEAKILEVNRKKKQIRLSIKAILPKPEEVTPKVKKEPRKDKNKRSKRTKAEKENTEAQPAESEPTTMEIAWREALEKAENKKGEPNRSKKTKSGASQEREDIFNRTLENRLPTE